MPRGPSATFGLATAFVPAGACEAQKRIAPAIRRGTLYGGADTPSAGDGETGPATGWPRPSPGAMLRLREDAIRGTRREGERVSEDGACQATFFGAPASELPPLARPWRLLRRLVEQHERRRHAFRGNRVRGSPLSLPLTSSALMLTMRVNLPSRSKNGARL